MLNILLSGCNGYMGKAVTAAANTKPNVAIVAGVDINSAADAGYPVFGNFDELKGGSAKLPAADVIIDFSAPAALEALLEFSMSQKVPLVLCTTGYSPEQVESIEKASKNTPVFRSGNMSLGINLLMDLIARAASVLGEDFDVEIVERHHRRKVDAPSGTALMLADAASSALPYNVQYVYERESKREPRKKQEIGISAVRGGTITGVHDVIFAGQDEIIELRHTAASRDVFAVGALKAAEFMRGKSAGLYSMKDVLGK